MADNFLDTVLAVQVGNSLNNAGYQNIALENNARQRAKNIEDNLGIRAKSFDQYREEHGGRGILKALGIMAAGIAVGGAIALAASSWPVFAVAAVISTIGGSISQNRQQKRVRDGYSNYLDEVSAQGRAAHGISPAIEYDNGQGRTRTFAADVAASRAATAQNR